MSGRVVRTESPLCTNSLRSVSLGWLLTVSVRDNLVRLL